MIWRKLWWTPLLLLLASLACAIPIPTVEPLTILDPPVTETHTLDLQGAESAVIRLRMLSGRLALRPDPGATLLQGRFYYNVEEWEPNVNQESTDNKSRISVTQGLGSQLQLGKLDERYINEWEIGLTRNVPLELGIDLGSGTSQLDLGGLRLNDFSLTTGSSDIVLNFSQANPEPLSKLRLTAGTGKLVASGLGNANFDRLSVFGGAGTLDLDFTGSWKRSAIADIGAGAGNMTIRVPPDLGVRVELSGPISKVEIDGFSERQENEYVNAQYGQSPLTLTINITTGVGNITLISQ